MEREYLQNYLKAVLDVETAIYAHQKIEKDYVEASEKRKPQLPAKKQIPAPTRPIKPERIVQATPSNSDEAIDGFGEYIEYAVDKSTPLPLLVICLTIAFVIMCILPTIFVSFLGTIVILGAIILNCILFVTAKHRYKLHFVLGFLLSCIFPFGAAASKAIGGVVAFIACIAVSCAGSAYLYKEYKKYEQETSEIEDIKHAHNMSIYDIELRQYDRDYDSWQKQCNLETERYRKATAEYENNIIKYNAELNNTTNQLKKVGAELIEAREKLYSQNLIYEKYRNIVCIATLYEYISSGRCYELEGPNGAYNLYELELRQSIIINSLSTIISNLNQIQSNQFYLYKELQTANQLATQTVNGLISVDANTKLTAYYAEATAKAASADRYIIGVI